ncbi:MAG: ATP-binding protein [Magnetospiraceae bacterium]
MELRNDLAEISRFDERLKAFAKEAVLDERTVFALRLCGHEAITNIIHYGFPEGGNHVIEVDLQREAQVVHLQVIDNGMMFDPTAAPEPENFETIEDAQLGGQGINLIRGFASAVHYVRQDGLNILRIQVAIEEAPAS